MKGIDQYSLAERLESPTKEISYKIYHSIVNKEGGSWNTPIGRIEIKGRDSADGCNPHTEIRILLRNNVVMKWGILKIIKSPRKLNRAENLISKSELNKIISELIEIENIIEPYSIYRCVENVEEFQTFGDFFNLD
ncbi:hypothetical protein [uncultured Croceitalea sp.]|uniref:hypothetical protein n=1 Tax=uncultured Croceitalea sp. TaxID=1798908 RepID=UPI00330683A1